jgi:hypothetical protein
MIKKVLCAAFLFASLNSACGKATTKLPLVRKPSTIFIVGPGTIVSVHRIALPFAEPYYAVKYQTDGGDLIEVWTPGSGILVLEGMRGELTYSTHPERILNFRLASRAVTK